MANFTKKRQCLPFQVQKCITTSFGKEVCKCEYTDAAIGNATIIVNNIEKFVVNISKYLTCPHNSVKECKPLPNGKKLCICKK